MLLTQSDRMDSRSCKFENKIAVTVRTYMTKFTDEHGQQHLMNERNKLCVQWMKEGMEL